MTYDVIIIGAGTSGLFAAAAFEQRIHGLILNKSKAPGLKLLMSGGGQSNLTQAGDIKNFLTHYGEIGPKIRKSLYKYNNKTLIDFFQKHQLPVFQREDGKIFPKSLKSQDVLNLLLNTSQQNGFSLINRCAVQDLRLLPNGDAPSVFQLGTDTGEIYQAKNIIVATGGASYPTTGSDGNFQHVLQQLNLNLRAFIPSLVPIFVEKYNFSELSGISFPDASVSVAGHRQGGGLLLTHHQFSGPAILNASRYATNGSILSISYLPDKMATSFMAALKLQHPGNQKQISTTLLDIAHQLQLDLPKRFIDVLCTTSGIPPNSKTSSLSGKQLTELGSRLFKDTYKISGTSGFSLAMCSAGGVSLEEINTATFETKKYPGLYIIGEALDVDGDTGGYNIQFAFSSGFSCARSIQSSINPPEEMER